jgi:hypothetical protein
MSIQMNSTQTTQTRTERTQEFLIRGRSKHQRERQSPLGVWNKYNSYLATINVMSSVIVEGPTRCILVFAIVVNGTVSFGCKHVWGFLECVCFNGGIQKCLKSHNLEISEKTETARVERAVVKFCTSKNLVIRN